MYFIRFLNWGGVGSVALGGVLALLGFWKGKEARQLEAVREINSLSALKQLLNLVPLLVAITGRVWSEKPLRGELSNEEGAIVQVTEDRVTERRTELVWVKDSDTIRSVIRESEWGLEDNSGVKVPIVAGQEAGGSFMQVVADVWQPANEKLAGVVLGELSGRRYLGMRKTEKVLALGAPVTAVGELVAVTDHPKAYKGALRSHGMLYVLRAPKSGAPFLITRQSLSEMVADLNSSSQVCWQLSAVFAAVGASMLLLSAAQQLAARWRLRKLRLRVERARRARAEAAAASRSNGGATDDAQADLVEDDSENEEVVEGRVICVVCAERTCDMVFPSCGHMCVCMGCAKRGAMSRCPICRARGSPIRVYTP